MKRERIYYWDNLKGLLIFLVVLGHFLIPVKNAGRSIQSVYYFIYSFHMPAFVFVSGFFAKNYMNKKVPNISKLMGFLILYFLFEVLMWGTNSLLTGKIMGFDPMTETGAPWYLMAMFVWYVFFPIFAKLKPQYGIVIGFFIGTLSGFLDSIGPFLCLSRIAVFLPFFLVGYYFDMCAVNKLTSSNIKKISVIFLLLLFVFIFFNLKEINMYEAILYGNRPYVIFSNRMSETKVMLIRVGWYFVTFMIMFMIMSLVPKNKIKISYIGERTLSIYITHRILRQVFSYYDLYRMVPQNGTTVLGMCVMVSIVMTFVLSAKWLFLLFQRVFSINYEKIIIKDEKIDY